MKVSKCTHRLFALFFLVSVLCSVQTIYSNDESRKIATVVPRGSFIYAYDEKGSQLFALIGYTATTVSVRRGSFVYVYNEKGSQISAVSAGD